MRFFLLLVTFFLVTPLSWAELQAPTWDEFCPPQYLYTQPLPFDKSKLEKGKRYQKSSGIIWVVKGNDLVGQQSRAQENNHWYQRRKAFEGALSECEADPDKLSCYRRVRRIEQAKTEGHNYNSYSVRGKE